MIEDRIPQGEILPVAKIAPRLAPEVGVVAHDPTVVLALFAANVNSVFPAARKHFFRGFQLTGVQVVEVAVCARNRAVVVRLPTAAEVFQGRRGPPANDGQVRRRLGPLVHLVGAGRQLG